MKIISLLFLGILSFQVLATSPREALQLVKSGKAVLVDVREENEIKDGMIESAKWFPLSKIESDTNWKNDFTALTRDKKIFLYCRSGNRSEKVETILRNYKIESENIGGYLELKNQLPSVTP
jgi:rhodanese-related sulfurtransferase